MSFKQNDYFVIYIKCKFSQVLTFVYGHPLSKYSFFIDIHPDKLQFIWVFIEHKIVILFFKAISFFFDYLPYN